MRAMHVIASDKYRHLSSILQYEKKDTQEYIIYYETVHNITLPLSASMHKLVRKASWI